MSQPQRKNLQTMFAPEANTNKKESREKKDKQINTRMTCFRMNTEARKQLDILAVEEGETLQSLMCKAVNDLFLKYGKPTIA